MATTARRTTATARATQAHADRLESANDALLAAKERRDRDLMDAGLIPVELLGDITVVEGRHGHFATVTVTDPAAITALRREVRRRPDFDSIVLDQA